MGLEVPNIGHVKSILFEHHLHRFGLFLKIKRCQQLALSQYAGLKYKAGIQLLRAFQNLTKRSKTPQSAAPPPPFAKEIRSKDPQDLIFNY